MKKFLQKFNDLQLTIILEAVVGVFVIGLSFIGFAFAQYGWTIGAAVGTLVEMFSTFLVFKGSDAAIKENKSVLYLLCFFLRMILFTAVMVAFALLQYKIEVHVFDYSLFGALIGYTPMFILLIVGQIRTTHKMDKKVEEKFKEE